MKRLRVENFSCIKSGDIQIKRMMVVIGPQASGKSILCKLSYFFISSIHEQRAALHEGMSFDKYKEQVKNKFIEWFPPSAWGAGKFCIQFTIGKFDIKLSRTEYKGVIQDNFRIKISDDVAQKYSTSLANIKTIYEKSVESERDYEQSWRADKVIDSYIESIMGSDHLTNQLFVPAGRAFFTSIGKAMAFFEQGRMLDPIILRFGRTYASIKERFFVKNRRIPLESKAAMEATELSISRIFGGNLTLEGEREFVTAADGRQVPLASLSSGQQELLPLLVVLPWVSSTQSAKRLLYIEEPEAHLFPEAQSQLVEVLAEILNRAKLTSLVLTTHSPYVLSKINNLLKAGAMYKENGTSLRDSLSKVVPAAFWLSPEVATAYAIVDGVVLDIRDESGLIDADYLDGVSGNISGEFMRLLGLEAAL